VSVRDVTHYNMGIAARRERRWREAVLEFRAAALSDATDFDAVQNVVTTLAQAIEAGAPPLFSPSPLASLSPSPLGEGRGGGQPPRNSYSVIVCSVDVAREEAMRANIGRALAGRDHELVVIHDARSLCEGYQRGLDASRFPWVVFAHDDVELVGDDAFDALERALERHDVVGLAGSRVVNGPAVTWAGHPHIHGCVTYPETSNSALEVAAFSLEAGILGGMQALDGLFIAANRDAARRVGFDAATFDGFHFYDLDFTYRAHRAGLRLAVTTEIAAIHASAGQFDSAWNRYAARFLQKNPGLTAPVGPHHSYGARLASREHIRRFHDELNALAQHP